MKNVSTPMISAGNAISSFNSADSQPAPSKKSLAFIRQFARAYNFMPGFDTQLGGFIAN